MISNLIKLTFKLIYPGVWGVECRGRALERLLRDWGHWLAALAEYWDLIPSTHKVACSYL